MTDRSVPTTPDAASPTRPAATVLLLRDADVLEVLMLRRHARSGFAASAWVFPGGVVDAADTTLPEVSWTGIDPAALAEGFKLDAAATLGMYAAAVRETFEEAGVLLAHHRNGRPIDVPAADLAAMRADLNDRTVDADWSGFLLRHDLVLDLSAMTYWLRWVTPIQEPKRYDTCFFLAHCPPDANPQADAVETTQARWVNPAAALADDEFPMIFPTQRTMEWMATHDTAADLIMAAQAQPVIQPLQPHIFVDADGRYTGILLPSDEGYPHEVYS